MPKDFKKNFTKIWHLSTSWKIKQLIERELFLSDQLNSCLDMWLVYLLFNENSYVSLIYKFSSQV